MSLFGIKKWFLVEEGVRLTTVYGVHMILRLLVIKLHAQHTLLVVVSIIHSFFVAYSEFLKCCPIAFGKDSAHLDLPNSTCCDEA